MEKRRDLERHLRRHGCRMMREGSNHSVWLGPSGSKSTIPRHREIKRTTARTICRRLGVPDVR
jgi:hypothetical protein